jgi:hypothetical protein
MSKSLTLAREVAGVSLMAVGGALALTFLIATAGIGTTVVTAALLGLAAFGRWLASGTVPVTEPETERDSLPEGDGPLYIDPDDPEAFIPRY